MLGRLIVGFAVSLSAIAECIYIAEISPPVCNVHSIANFSFRSAHLYCIDENRAQGGVLPACLCTFETKLIKTEMVMVV